MSLWLVIFNIVVHSCLIMLLNAQFYPQLNEQGIIKGNMNVYLSSSNFGNSISLKE